MGYNFWKNIKIKKGSGGAGAVTEDEKYAIIEDADSTWGEMGLTQEQKAFGIATMNVESGFNPEAENPAPKSTAYGLGQFTDPAWETAVKYYNAKFRDKGEPRIDADSSRSDTDAQIKVTGAWIERVWERAGVIAGDPALEDYNFMETAYGVWHEGTGARVEDYINKDGKNVPGIKTFLDGEYSHSSLRSSFNGTYVEAHDALDKKDILSKTSGTKRRSGQTGGAWETLRRQGNEVWRILSDGGTRGYFISE
ncbi:MAG: hypothetical protein HZB22_08115 [Deltaproteobacteria bacterium]|nr:hypothetical protein [Deltaproteobacteria bacterium]